MSFEGFTEADIFRLNSGRLPDESIGKVASLTSKKHSNKNTLNRILNNKKEKKITTLLDIPEEAKLNPTQQEHIPKDLPEISQVNENTKGNNPVDETKNENINSAQNIDESNPSEVSLARKKFIDLDEFQARQKRIEEQNRHRKELLAKALADRKKQTEEEAQRLHEINIQFRKLDALLSNDVKILRSQIEVATLEYSEAQKRYNRIEKEFLDAKLNLHQKLEKKELLTEHLCAIIEKNEERKAEKLTELLQKLDLKIVNLEEPHKVKTPEKEDAKA